MYNLVEYSKNYRKTTGSLWSYYRDKPNNPLAYNYNVDTITNLRHLNTKTILREKREIMITVIITQKMSKLPYH